ncbi:type VI secretion system accessory protein TagJ [Erwinia sorbitola]|uniref:ImpE family T6SS protein Cts1E n=1 Tax=Erwinia sorbitola TaxID=2681984 RepID=A0A6I6EHI5_9GAMM|nr:type VI secretion system accessory protein TagJ [Erwinia sorbitola]MTD28157.1 ImpE family T6SS protein Cts1E [Erwinia sorbitola]QGU85846.1 ImpE family T6SS protein Cts1E [Erwinia sorbitola]
MDTTTSLYGALKSSSLEEILANCLSQVRSNPDDISLRETLYRLYCLEGSWQKALMQLQTIEVIKPDLVQQVEITKNLVFSELIREEVLRGERLPGMLNIELPEWISLLQQANKSLAEGAITEQEEQRSQAFSMVSVTAGDGPHTGPFSWIADSDGRIGPACEFIVAGGYRWVPFSEIKSLSIEKPTELIDLVWSKAHIQTSSDVYYGYIPSRYPLTDNVSQDAKLGLVTEWEDISSSCTRASGRKVIITDSSEFSLLESEKIMFA